MDAAAAKDDVSLPKATVCKLLDDILPSDTRMTQEVRELFVDCCTEFINLISSEANEISGKDNRKTIGPEHVMKALETLGFESYIEEVKASHAQHKVDSKEGAKHNLKKARTSTMTQEEAIAAQAALFAAARAACDSGGAPE